MDSTTEEDDVTNGRKGLTIAFSANFLISLMARGARFLKETPCIYEDHTDRSSQQWSIGNCRDESSDVDSQQRTRLCMWIVYSLATTSAMADRPVLPPRVVVALTLGLTLDDMMVRLS